MGGARIGERCILGQNVFVGGTAVIGNGVKILLDIDKVLSADEMTLLEKAA